MQSFVSGNSEPAAQWISNEVCGLTHVHYNPVILFFAPCAFLLQTPAHAPPCSAPLSTVSWLQNILPQLTISFLRSRYHFLVIRRRLRIGFLGDSGWVESLLGTLGWSWLLIFFHCDYCVWPPVPRSCACSWYSSCFGRGQFVLLSAPSIHPFHLTQLERNSQLYLAEIYSIEDMKPL